MKKCGKPKRRHLTPVRYHVRTAPVGWQDDPDFVVISDETTAREVIGKIVVCHCRRQSWNDRCRCEKLIGDANDLLDESSLMISRCSLSRGRWFWMVFPRRGWCDLMCEDNPIMLAEGISSSSAQAEADARSSVRGTSEWIDNAPTVFARRFYTRRMRKKRAHDSVRNGKHDETRVKQYVWRRWWDEDGRSRWTSHLIAKKTKKRVYAYRQFSEIAIDFDPTTFILDREKLERGEEVRSRVCGSYFVLQPKDHPYSDDTPACVAFFGLTMPCDLSLLKRAYVAMAHKTHPDHGGNSADFKVVKERYEEAVAVITK